MDTRGVRHVQILQIEESAITFLQHVNGLVRLKLYQCISFMIELSCLLFILYPVDRKDDSGTSQLDRFVSNTCFKEAHSTSDCVVNISFLLLLLHLSPTHWLCKASLSIRGRNIDLSYN